MTHQQPEPGRPEGDQSGLTRGDLQDRAIRGASWTMINTVVSLPLAFAVNIVLARTLGVVDYGRLAYLTTVIGIVSGIVELGTGTGLLQFGSKAHALGQTATVQRLLSSIQGFRLFITAPLLALVVFLVADVSAPMLAVAVVFGVLVPAVFSTAIDCINIENKTAASAKLAMVTNLVAQIAVSAVAVAITTADAVWATRLVIGQVLFGLLCLAFVAPEYRKAVLRPRWPGGLPEGFWRFAIPVGAAGVIGTLVVSRSEVVMLGWLDQPAAAGIFAMAFGLAGHIFAPAQALIGPMVPAISGLREVDEASVGRAFTRALRGTSTIVGMLVAVALPAFAALVPSIYGGQFAQVPPVMLLLGLAGGLLVVTGPVQAFVQARLAGGRVLLVNVIALSVDIVLAVLLIPPLGVWGAVIANVAASWTQLVGFLAGELRSLDMGWLVVARQSRPFVLGAGVCGAVWGLVWWIDVSPVLAAMIAGSVGLALFSTGLRAGRTGFTSGDTHAIIRTVPVRMRPLARGVLAMCAFDRSPE
ncbi:Membrane protein involved in the export of O-antigen and teichoic acid [Raineyella antarctica]|uniref:Membrane protein involved in the export of O-antigen and teichoic acid n=1 Tax=Raineyella antarctica TaxID=1577474 RepID=A0A1G6GD00_9ACTN|nr:oligosaccharide flippase family protein [Raineyella antarctica]SDB79867.1 Membrane protein involved in the export of O-antigen and teichoic acid [Raineyella antarctica]